jgi:hypothetical protein
VRKLLNLLLLASILAVGVAHRKRIELPDADDVLEVDHAPIQEPTSEPKFDFEYSDKSYVVQPVAQYELWGLVVSHNNIAAIDDIYHDSSSVDLKDLCVIWGPNVEDNNYNKVKFWSEPWSCQFQTDDMEAFRAFSKDALSNNHLLSDDPEVRSKIRQARIGDQIHLTGWLVNYYPVGLPDHVRKSSTIRTDTGNGACEVVFVKSFEILARANVFWNRCYQIALLAVYLLVGLKLVLFVRACFRLYR